MKCDVERDARCFEVKERIFFIRFPEPERTGRTATCSNDKLTRAVPTHSPAGAARISLWCQHVETLASLPVKNDNCWFASAGKGVSHFADTCYRERFSVGTEVHTADSATIGLEFFVPADQNSRVQIADVAPRSDLPLFQHPHQITRNDMFSVGMESDVVNVPRVAAEFLDQCAVHGGPDFDQVIIASCNDVLTVGADRDRTHVSLMGVDGALWSWCLRKQVPPDEASLVRAGNERLAIGMKVEPSHPAAMSFHRGPAVSQEVPAMNEIVMRSGEEVIAGIIKATGPHGAVVFQFHDLPNQLGIGCGWRFLKGSHSFDRNLGKLLGVCSRIFRRQFCIDQRFGCGRFLCQVFFSSGFFRICLLFLFDLVGQFCLGIFGGDDHDGEDALGGE